MGQGPRYPSYETPYEQAYPSHDDRFAEPVDLDAFGSQLRTNRPARSIVTREEFLPDDSVPLFLSGSDEELHSPKFGRPRKKTTSRLLKTGAFAVAATIATFVAVKNPFTVFANATASLMGTQDSRSTPAPVAPATRQAEASAPAPTVVAVATPTQAVAAATPAQAVAAATPAQAIPAQQPSRDEIAVALRSAHQNLAPEAPPSAPAAPPVVVAAVTPVVPVTPAVPAPVAAVAPVTAVAPAVVAPPPIRRLGADELATLMTRGRALLDSGDIPPARLLLERAAEAGEASAALMLAQTYDPSVLGSLDIRNITGDPAMARKWYQRAAQLGSADAQRRLSQLQ